LPGGAGPWTRAGPRFDGRETQRFACRWWRIDSLAPPHSLSFLPYSLPPSLPLAHSFPTQSFTHVRSLAVLSCTLSLTLNLALVLCPSLPLSFRPPSHPALRPSVPAPSPLRLGQRRPTPPASRLRRPAPASAGAAEPMRSGHVSPLHRGLGRRLGRFSPARHSGALHPAPALPARPASAFDRRALASHPQPPPPPCPFPPPHPHRLQQPRHWSDDADPRPSRGRASAESTGRVSAESQKRLPPNKANRGRRRRRRTGSLNPASTCSTFPSANRRGAAALGWRAAQWCGSMRLRAKGRRRGCRHTTPRHHGTSDRKQNACLHWDFNTAACLRLRLDPTRTCAAGPEAGGRPSHVLLRRRSGCAALNGLKWCGKWLIMSSFSNKTLPSYTHPSPQTAISLSAASASRAAAEMK
jgi:hypothetical protein